MDYTGAARAMIAQAFDLEDKALGKPKQDHRGLTVQHAHWMLLQIIQHEDDWSQSKRGRWLGWAQAIFCFLGFFDLDEMKELNKKHSDHKSEEEGDLADIENELRDLRHEDVANKLEELRKRIFGQ